MAGFRAAARAAAVGAVMVAGLGVAVPAAGQAVDGMDEEVMAVAAVPSAQTSVAARAAETERRGPVTGLPMPRYVSLKGGEGNARRGPGLTHRVDWVFRHRNMPLRVTAEFEHWRRVEDAEGQGGWMHFALLSGIRHVLVQQDMTPLHLQADTRAPVVGYMEAGVVARIQSCERDWCRLRVDGLRGWAPRSGLWGVAEGELID